MNKKVQGGVRGFTKPRTAGFTLIEILIVIGIIAILAAVVLVAVNPAKNFREAANAQRSANVNAIINAISQFTVDTKGDLPDGLPTSGTEEISEDGMGSADFESFCRDLVPDYIGALPGDPDANDQAVSNCETDGVDLNTEYEVTVDSGRVTISAPNTVDIESGNTVTADEDIIAVTR